MKLSSRIKPISHFKANAAEIVRAIADSAEPIIITQNGEAKAVLQDIKAYEQTQETLALLKIIAIGNREIATGETRPAQEVLDELSEQ